MMSPFFGVVHNMDEVYSIRMVYIHAHNHDLFIASLKLAITIQIPVYQHATIMANHDSLSELPHEKASTLFPIMLD